MPNTSHLYSLRRGLGLWQLTFGGRSTVLKHEQGILYVAYLLYHPPLEPIHALDLVARVQGFNSAFGGTLVPTSSGALIVPDKCARLQERSPALDEMETLRALRRKEQELEALLDDQEASEPLKAEAWRELEAIENYQRQSSQRSADTARRTVRAVRMALGRFHRRLIAATDTEGQPHPILRGFAEHLDRHLLLPSVRYAGRSASRGGAAGCFTYEPPASVVWR